MLQALERRLAAIDTLEGQLGRVEGLIGQVGAAGLAQRLSQIETILSVQGPARLETRLAQLEAVLLRTGERLDSRLGELQGRVTQHGGFADTAPGSERSLDERRLQQLCLNLSDLQENLRLERRLLRKKAESLGQAH